ncbi:hypothetical protein [Pseudomonas mediterranea]|uniref:DUF4760 domain-containing protein n=1 Tax=Pseudomonas mediterranea TaxID=183795 RepID=A0AAX2DIW9_9PSED|nr:hypothetical protein [Pseudomonas mediterranea]KGU84857.1 hypothetical protein N005_15990 [Pseudomonas mediterranea CFBP 5447]SDU74812.1 hypothetical protein SAMN05216476_5288 [Pseudomonas mediterranea]
MRRDWMVWLGCFLLFGCGAVWAMVPLNISFFEVNSIHDLFDMFSSAATVYVVVFGVELWRRQVSGQADLELARKVAVLALRIKEASLEAWIDAKFSINQHGYGLNSLGAELMDKISQRMGERLKIRESLQIDFLLVLQEARAIWGVDFSKKYNGIIKLYFECNRCSKAYLSWVDTSEPNFSRKQFSQTIAEVHDYLSKVGFFNAEGRMEKEINHLTLAADLALEKKMLRSSNR